MQLVVVCLGLELVDSLLPVCREDVSVSALKALVYLRTIELQDRVDKIVYLHLPRLLCRILRRAQTLAQKASLS